MIIKHNFEEDLLTIFLEGRLDGSSAPDLLKFYEETIRQNKLTGINLDISKLEYSSSAGLRIMMMMYKEFKDNFYISGANNEIMEIFETTGFKDYLNFK